jgi:hypothetical protein
MRRIDSVLMRTNKHRYGGRGNVVDQGMRTRENKISLVRYRVQCIQIDREGVTPALGNPVVKSSRAQVKDFADLQQKSGNSTAYAAIYFCKAEYLKY